MADVFISYHRSEGASALVRRIAGELESRGVSCWYDAKNTAPVDFVERIVTEIECCKVFLFLWDEQANEDSKKRNSYVRREMHRAFKKNVALIPFQVGDFEKNPTVEFYFDTINISYGGDSFETAQTDELVNALADALGKTQPPSVVTQSQPITPKIIKSGYCGQDAKNDNVMYTLHENGILAISGNGAMRVFRSFDEIPWWDEREMISHVEIQNGVTKIGGSAFQGCENLTNVFIPDSVIYIGGWAFNGCEKLESVSVPAKAQIGWKAFSRAVQVTRREPAENQ